MRGVGALSLLVGRGGFRPKQPGTFGEQAHAFASGDSAAAFLVWRMRAELKKPRRLPDGSIAAGVFDVHVDPDATEEQRRWLRIALERLRTRDGWAVFDLRSALPNAVAVYRVARVPKRR